MSITAVLVAADLRYLEHSLVALREQHLQPERVILVDARAEGATDGLLDAARGAGLGGSVEVHEARQARNFGAAVEAALEDAPEVTSQWLWFLHDDSPPEPGALAELAKATASARAVGIAGCKQLDFDDPSRLLSVGVRYTRAGRRVAEIEPGEIDQGQFDDREDVYAVGTAGMLIRRDTWESLGGLDPTLGPFMDGTELSRRARLAGERVIVVPTAKVRHARATLWHGPSRAAPLRDGANSFLARRTATLHFRLLTTNLWTLLLVALGMLIAAPIRALWRVATNDLSLAWQELRAPLIALSRVGDVARGRRRIARAATTPRGVLRPLYTTRFEVWRLWWHRWRAGRVERRRRVAPSELEISERRTIARRRRATLVAVTLAVAGVGALLVPRVFAGSVFDFPALVGGGLSGVDQSYSELWERALSGWSPAGDGSAAPQHPFAMVLAALATAMGGPMGVPASAVVNILLAFALPLAGVSAWFASGALTRSVLLRAWSALAWAFLPVLSLELNHGRLGALIAHILLPLLALSLARTFGRNQRDVIRSGMDDAGQGGAHGRIPVVSRASETPSTGAAAAAGLLLATITASAPILLPAMLVLLIVVAVVAPVGRARLTLVALPAVVLWLPQAVYASNHGWASLLRSPETTPVHLTVFPGQEGLWSETIPWYAMTGWVHAPNSPLVPAIAAALVGGVALVGLLRGGTAGRAARWGWLLSGVGVATVVASQHLLRAPQYDWLGSFQRLPEWAGPGVSLAAGGTIIAASAGVMGTRELLNSRSVGALHGGVGLMTAVLVGVMVAGGVNSVQTLSEEPQWQTRQIEPLPALARQIVSGESRSRVLMLAPSEGRVVAQLWRDNGPQLLDPHWNPRESDPAREALMELVAELSTGAGKELERRLAEHAIGFVLIPASDSPHAPMDPHSREELAAALDGLAALEPVTENEAGALWRVAAESARVRAVRGEEEVAVPSGMTSVDTAMPELPAGQGGSLVLAERADPRWRATLDGEALRSVDGSGWQQSFDLPADASGKLTVEYSPLLHRVWKVGIVVVFGFALVLSLPVRKRPEVVA